MQSVRWSNAIRQSVTRIEFTEEMLVKSNQLPIFLLPGMTRDYPVFSRLMPLLSNVTIVNFPDPEPNESLPNYAKRMADHFPQDCIIAGVSFGGILALEISRIIQPTGCILISSVSSPRQFPPGIRACRSFGVLNCMRLLKATGWLTTWLPKSIRPAFLMRMVKLTGDSSHWYRWAMSAVLDWRPNSTGLNSPVLQIHGDADTTFPVRYVTPDVVIRNGRHGLPISNPIETADAIVDFIESISR